MLEIPANVLFRELEGECFLVNVDTGYYFALNPVGSRMWRALERHGSLAGALTELGDEYEAEPGRLRADLAELVGRLKRHGLIEETAEPP